MSCAIEDCDSPVAARGWCNKHYLRWLKRGDPLIVHVVPTSCAVEDCDSPSRAWGLCPKHYSRARKYGDPLVTFRIVGDDAARFWAKVDKNGPGGCWLWSAYVNPDGYAVFRVGPKKVLVHRWSYEHTKGPIPDGLEIDHLCRVRHCVNPLHLEAVTPRVNTLRSDGIAAKYAARTHCSRGHEFTPENTTLDGTARRCRQCRGSRRVETA